MALAEAKVIPMESHGENGSSKKAEDKEYQEKRHILSEHMDVFPDMKEGKDNKFTDGMIIHVGTSDDDDLHIKEHSNFLKEYGSSLTMKGRTRLENHIEKHEMQKILKKKMFGSHSSMMKHDHMDY